MTLPNWINARIDITKLKNYVLNDGHPTGKFKARVFLSALSLKSSDAEKLRNEILKGLGQGEAITGHNDYYGTRYFVDINISNFNQKATVRTVWISLKNEEFPRLITCYVKT
ncbi:MAG: hypothetical protein KF687_04080 [Cyclobacteriaceae bacterium]|nr:hypothetical protein [Cyclobacteriaceae bacterium]